MLVDERRSKPARTDSAYERRLPVGAEVSPAGVHFRVWAPRRKSVQVILDGQPGKAHRLEDESNGYFSGLITEAKAGSLYQFKLDAEDQLYPDPVSRFQPSGPHGPSQVVDPRQFQWTDLNWKGIGAVGQVLYELHVGTFTEAGTWAAAAEQLESLRDLGITCLEVMPVAEFAGRFGWGYDGVDLFAPTHLYGKPDDFRRFVDRAHSLGIAVILDVVYNHFGPAGNYLMQFSNHYLSDKHKNDWGQSINFDGEGAAGTREFYVSNVRHWISEYHMDGFRFDATQAILDDSPRHILAEISAAARAAAGERSIYLITENEPQDTRIVRKPDAGGYGFDALWNDDFHHSAIVSLIGRNEAFFTDYQGRPQEFISAVKWGYLYQGQFYKWQKKRRGTSALDLLPTAFVNYIQNHDQIANYAHGQRAHHLSSLAHYRAMTALLLLAPQTPMLFQGQEFGSSSTFHYFADHDPELNKLIAQGRAKEMAQFTSVAQPEMQACLRDPSSEETFRRCKLDHSEKDKGYHQRLYALHKDLLKLRREEPVFARVQKRGDIEGAVLGTDAFALRFFSENPEQERLLVINFGIDLPLDIVPEPLLAAPSGMRWVNVWSSENPRYGGSGCSALEVCQVDWRTPTENWRLPGRCAVVLKPVVVSEHDRESEREIERRRQEEKSHEHS